MVTKIIVAKDNTSFFSCYQKCFSKDETIEIIGYASDGESAIKMYKEKNPDLMLLNLGLPKKNGLEILNELTNCKDIINKCNIVVTSGNLTLMHSLYNTRTVYNIIPKPFSLIILKNTIDEFRKEQHLDGFSEIKCQELLIKLKLNPYSKNGRLLTESINLCYDNLELLDNMKNIYSILANKYSCSPEKTKSSIRSIIGTANKFSSSTALNSIFYITDDDVNKTVSPKQFINGMLICLKR